MPGEVPSAYWEASPTDRALLIVDRTSAVTFHLVAEFTGRIDDDRMRAAWRLTSCRHPILLARFEAEHPPFGRWAPSLRQPEYLSITCDEGARPTLVRDLCAEDMTPITGRTARVVAIHAAHETTVVLSIHHAAMDGRAGLMVFDDLRRRYGARTGRGEPAPDVTPRTMSTALRAADVPSDVVRDIVRAGGRRWADAWSSHREPDTIRPRCPEERDVATHDIDPHALAALDDMRRRFRWSVTDVLLTALARAWEEVIGRDHRDPARSGWLVTADLRPRLGTVGGAGNLSGTEPVLLDDVARLRPREAIAQTNRELSVLRSGWPGLFADLAVATGVLPARSFDRALGRLLGIARQRCMTRTFANFGVVPDEATAWDGVTVARLWWAPPLADPSYVNATFLRACGRTTLCLRTGSTGLGKADARDLCDAITAELWDAARQ
jgi:NRPS condensation-like uncharacterized protein